MEDRQWLPMTMFTCRPLLLLLGATLMAGSSWAQSADSLRTSTIRVRGEGTVQAEPDRSSRRYSGNAITVAGAGRQRGADFFPQFIPVQSAITITFAAHPQSTHDR